MLKYHEVEIAGLSRKLPLYQVDEGTFIPLFIAYNDVPLIQAAAKALLEKVADFDVILTEEIQGITLAYAMSLLAGKDRIIVARKSAKAYMDDAVAIQVIDHEEPDEDDEGGASIVYKRLYVSQDDAAYIKNKRVLLVDDVVLHGRTMCSLTELTNALGGYVVGEASIIRHGFYDQSEDDNQVYLLSLPLYGEEGEEIDVDE